MPGKDINNNFFREDGDEQIAILDMGGDSSIRSDIVQKHFEIFNRSLTYSTAETDSLTIYSLLQETSAILTTATQIIKVEVLPKFMLQDDKRRFIFMSSYFIRAAGL